MKRLVRILVVALCCLVISFPVLAQETQRGRAGGQHGAKGQKKAARTHVRSTRKGSVKKAKKGQTKKTPKKSTNKTRSAKKTTGKSHSSHTKKGAPKSTRKVPSTK
jgi:hypothetical protein